MLLALQSAVDGDFSVRVPVDSDGALGAVASALNALLARNEALTHELARVSTVVGQEGATAERASLDDAEGSWAVAIDSFNSVLGDLVWPMKEIARVISSVAAGDLSKTMNLQVGARPLRGEVLLIGKTVNAFVDQLIQVSSAVTRVANEVGAEGKLGAQADVRAAAGAWRDLINSVNMLAGNLTRQVRNIALVTTAVANGDLSQKIDVDAKGEILALKNTINVMVDQLRSFAGEVTRVAREVGTEGRLGGQARVPGVAGTWQDLTDSVNGMATNLTNQVRGIVKVVTAVAGGDLSQKLVVDAKGEIAALADTINDMTDTLRTFADQVTAVAREVGIEGKLGGQARVSGAAGTWRALTDNVNVLAGNLTSQVRNIALVITAIANGDLSKKITVDARGEILELKETINETVEKLRTFAAEVTRVAREVGVEGKLGGQARVPGAAGTWRDLTDNVNQLAGNLTTQVRAIAAVATSVTKGDLSGTIDVKAQGEVLALKDALNQMIVNLRDTTQTNKEQNWLKTNLAKFTALMQGQRSLTALGDLLMSELPAAVSSQIATFFVLQETPGVEPVLTLVSSYGYKHRKHLSSTFALGEGMVGQAAREKKTIVITDVPDDYVLISSSLGEARPRNLVVLPVVFEAQVKGVIELGSFQPFTPVQITLLEQLALSIGTVFNIIDASPRTEELLQQLQRSNIDLETRSKELSDKASLLELKNREIAEASTSLEEKAKQLALSSKCKSEFLANMSHELRTPLNSVIILANLLADNADGRLSSQQVEFARTILSSGRDLLALISQILDLSKIEAGKMEIERRQVPLGEIRQYLETHYASVASQKNLGFRISISPEAPATITTDSQRFQQILKNLITNAFKFTEVGSVELRIDLEPNTGRFKSPVLRRAAAALACAVIDTGLGIPEDKQQIIFEAFQQADTSTSRMYGGTGLGLTISRELARLLGGEIQPRSAPGEGSTFTLYLPLEPEDRMPSSPRGGLEEEPTTVEPRPVPAVAPVAQGAAGEARIPNQLKGMTILVVDDDVRNVFAVASLLESEGATVLTAGNADEAFAALEKSPEVSAVLMDLMMPGIDGYQATGKLRADPRFAGLPIVALTAKAMPGDRERALGAGCTGFVPKPVDRSVLVEVLLQANPVGEKAP